MTLFTVPVVLINLFVFVAVSNGQALSRITLAQCHDKAVLSYPLSGDKQLIRDISELKVRNIQTANLPQLSINGQATYQSDVVKINLPPQFNFGIPSPYNDQYKLTIDAQQVLFDGGIAAKQKKIEQVSSAIEIQQIETDLLRIREQVNNLYFTILTFQANRKLLNNVLQVLKDRERNIQSLVKNGVLLKSDENVLTSERLKTEQQLTELDINCASTIRVLGVLINENLSDSTVFDIPEIMVTTKDFSGRPEFKAFELQEERLSSASSLSKTSIIPKIYVFGQYGYGRPGLNMLNNEFDDFYILGASFRWNFWDWNKTYREKQVYSLQKQMISNKKDNFLKNLTMDIHNRKATIEKLEEALKRDADIVALRVGITEIAQSQLNNGIITSTDYVSELNSETQARINLETRKIQLLFAKANYLLALGN